MTQTEVPTPSAPQLDYATAPSVVRSRWFRRIILVSVLLAIAIGSWRYGGAILSQVRVLWWQRTSRARSADNC